MKKRTLIYPVKVKWVMRDFMNEISPLLYKDGNNYLPQKCSMIKSFQFAACCQQTQEALEREKEFCVFYNIDELFCTGMMQFRTDFVKRYQGGKGFATITLTLLHEMGHLITYPINGQEWLKIRQEKMPEILSVPKSTRNFLYFTLPDEYAATQWAIEWLQDPEHRKIAKAFEKKFFACFA